MHETCYETAYTKLHVDLQAEPTRTSPHGHHNTRSLTDTTVLEGLKCKQDVASFTVQLIGTLKYVAAAMQAYTSRISIVAAVHMQLNVWHCVNISLCCTQMLLRYCKLLTLSALSSASIKLALYSGAMMSHLEGSLADMIGDISETMLLFASLLSDTSLEKNQQILLQMIRDVRAVTKNRIKHFAHPEHANNKYWRRNKKTRTYKLLIVLYTCHQNIMHKIKLKHVLKSYATQTTKPSETTMKEKPKENGAEEGDHW